MEGMSPRFADAATQHTVTVIENVQLARDTFRVRFACPSIAGRVTPGQFLMVRLANFDDPLIGRAFALYDVAMGTSGSAEYVDVVYLVGGKLTTRLARFQPGQQLVVWGPLGNGFDFPSTQHLVMVAGGIGQTPFLAVAKEFLGRQSYGSVSRFEPLDGGTRRVTFCYGVRSSDYLADVDRFLELGVDVRITTEDGSAGHHGRVTDLLPDVFTNHDDEPCQVMCCGPEPMMEAVARLTLTRGVPTLVSLETPMACGIGICFSCVAEICDANGDVDYRRTCVEGPVFDAQRVFPG